MTAADTYRFMRFCFIGAVVTGINYLLLIGLVAAGLHYLVANSVAWVACVCINFFGTRKFTFRRDGAVQMNEVAGFAGTYAAQYCIATVAMALFVERAGATIHLAFLLTLVTTTLFSYTVLRRLVFSAPR